MSSPAELKAKARARLRQVLRTLPSPAQTDAPVAIALILVGQEVWLRAKTVLAYAAKGAEIDLLPAMIQGVEQGKIIGLPRFVSERAGYEIRRFDPSRPLEQGAFGVLEPSPGAPLIPPNQLDLAFVPGLGFDLFGGRLGRGGGHYDRILAATRGHRCGVAWDVQIGPALPLEPHDIRMNSILTPTRWVDIQSGLELP